MRRKPEFGKDHIGSGIKKLPYSQRAVWQFSDSLTCHMHK